MSDVDVLDVLMEYQPDLVNLSECLDKLEEVICNLTPIDDNQKLLFLTIQLKQMIQMKMGELTQDMINESLHENKNCEEDCDKKCDCTACE